jgi:DNA-directed RNA polymerase I, II, and III subunit RPABC1
MTILKKVETEQWRLYLVYKTLYEMLSDRNYNIYEVPTFDNFLNHFAHPNGIELFPKKSNLTFIANKNKIGSLVYFIDDDSVGIKHVVKIYDLMTDKNITHCIVIYPQMITFSAKRYINQKKDINIEFFNEDELLINKTRHCLAPSYKIATKDDLKEYNIDEDLKSHLPKILSNDHISKYFGLKRGHIIKVIRKSETNGECITFRLCE